jgi:hypothetical protein
MRHNHLTSARLNFVPKALEWDQAQNSCSRCVVVELLNESAIEITQQYATRPSCGNTSQCNQTRVHLMSHVKHINNPARVTDSFREQRAATL